MIVVLNSEYCQQTCRIRTVQLFSFVCLLLTGLGACSTPQPLLDRPLLPQAYRIGSVPPARLINIAPGIHALALNDQHAFNNRVLAFWRDGRLMDAFQRIQPLTMVFREDIVNLSTFLNHHFLVYLLVIETSHPLPKETLRNQLIRRLNCNPLSNLEIRFQMNVDQIKPFSRKPLTLLLISIHELALQYGAEPVYPEVYSPYLRRRQQLPPIGKLGDINLFATKNENKVYSSSVNGFIVCSRPSANHSSQSAGPP